MEESKMTEEEYRNIFENEVDAAVENRGGSVYSRQLLGLIDVIAKVLYRLEQRIQKLENK
jgi:hypothetical protein